MDAVSGIAKGLAPSGSDPLWMDAGALPLTRLEADDFRLPEHFLNAPFPAPPSDAERSKVREFLSGVKKKAQLSGLLGGKNEHAAAAVSAEPNVASSPEAETASAVLAKKDAPTPPLRRQVPHFEPPLGPLATRIRALVDWIRRQLDSQDIFIVDEQGCPVNDREATPEILPAAIALADASRRALAHLPGDTGGALCLDLRDDRKLCVIDATTSAGRYTLCLILPEGLATRAADRLRRALRRTVDAEPAPAPVTPRERW